MPEQYTAPFDVEPTPERVDNSNPEARQVLAELDETVALLAAEILGG